MPSNKKLDAALDLVKSDPSKLLGVTIGTNTITKPGHFVPRADTKPTPELTLPPTASPTKTYLALALDPDAPFASFPVLGPILHWFQPGLQATATAAGASRSGGPPQQLSTTAPSIASWAAAGPPPGSGPHRYVVVLYEQPEGFELGKGVVPEGGKEMTLSGRVRTSLDEWVDRLGLGEPVGVNWFTSK